MTSSNILGANVNRIHCMGIGGVGMSGIADLLHQLGFQVSGSDLRCNTAVERLIACGVPVFIGHAPEHIDQIDLVVVSGAVQQDNPELQAAIAQGIPVVPRAQMLAELMGRQYGIAVTGTHGKTTTTGFLVEIFRQAGVDPSFSVGGELHQTRTNAHLGSGPHFIAEADESDASFLFMRPNIAVITNIDHDHMMTYNHDEQLLKQAFVSFLQALPADGVAVMCIDDPLTASIMDQAPCRVVSYGVDPRADVCLLSQQQVGLISHFTVSAPQYDVVAQHCQLNALGHHNALNVLAAMAVAFECDVPLSPILTAMRNVAGVGRRCQHYGDVAWHDKKITLLDDYGHHPQEVALTYQAVKAAYPGRRVVLVYQPHRYTRTQALFDDFVIALSQVDTLLLTEVYAAGETPIPGADAQALCQAISHASQLIPHYACTSVDIATQLADLLEDGDVLLTQGAGDIGQFIPHWKQSLAKQTDEVSV